MNEQPSQVKHGFEILIVKVNYILKNFNKNCHQDQQNKYYAFPNEINKYL